MVEFNFSLKVVERKRLMQYNFTPTHKRWRVTEWKSPLSIPPKLNLWLWILPLSFFCTLIRTSNNQGRMKLRLPPFCNPKQKENDCSRKRQIKIEEKRMARIWLIKIVQHQLSNYRYQIFARTLLMTNTIQWLPRQIKSTYNGINTQQLESTQKKTKK